MRSDMHSCGESWITSAVSILNWGTGATGSSKNHNTGISTICVRSEMRSWRRSSTSSESEGLIFASPQAGHLVDRRSVRAYAPRCALGVCPSPLCPRSRRTTMLPRGSTCTPSLHMTAAATLWRARRRSRSCCSTGTLPPVSLTRGGAQCLNKHMPRLCHGHTSPCQRTGTFHINSY